MVLLELADLRLGCRYDSGASWETCWVPLACLLLGLPVIWLPIFFILVRNVILVSAPSADSWLRLEENTRCILRLDCCQPPNRSRPQQLTRLMYDLSRPLSGSKVWVYRKSQSCGSCESPFCRMPSFCVFVLPLFAFVHLVSGCSKKPSLAGGGSPKISSGSVQSETIALQPVGTFVNTPGTECQGSGDST